MTPTNTSTTTAGTVCDLLVIGSGAAGLSAAITARRHGLDVIVVEKEPQLGGATAVSGGWLSIPDNHLAAEAGMADNAQAARRYLQHEATTAFDPERVDAFIENGRRMVEFFQRETEVRLTAGARFPDYHPDAPGGSQGGRSIVTEAFDARALGENLAKLRRPLRETTFIGLNIGSGSEVNHFFNATRSIRSAVYVASRIAAHLLDMLRYGRGMRLANGNALAARLAKSAFDLGVQVWLSTPAVRLQRDNGAVCGAVVRTTEGDVRIAARRGVVLACGGFSHDVARRKQLFPHAPTGAEHNSPSPSGIAGDGLRLGEAVGGAIETRLPNAAAWMPVSVVRYRDGSTGVFPHVIDRAKPGVIAVTRQGRRFVNEACPYHDFVQAMVAANAGEAEVTAFLVCDRRTIRRYGLGCVKPFPLPLKPHLDFGYLLTGRTLIDLAQRAGIDPAGLEATVNAYNPPASEGRDPQFGKGSTAYNKFQGDPRHGPNPCLAPLVQPPFYAVRIGPGDIGTVRRPEDRPLRTSFDGRRHADHRVYAAGNDMASMMGGSYPGAGINLGPAMTFGYIVGRHASGANV